MNRRERRKQQKKKERQERLRQEKHVHPSPPHTAAEGEIEDADVDSAEDVSEPAPASPTAEERRVYRPDGPLDNFFKGEPAQKWLDTLLAGNDVNPLVRTLDPVEYVPGDLMLKASVCCEILVAAELVAAGIGRPSRHLPAQVAAWLQEQDVVISPGVAMLAAKAVRRVGDFSELRHRGIVGAVT